MLFKSALPPREREMAILRVGWLCRSGYEFHQHTRIGKQAGLSDEEIERLKSRPRRSRLDRSGVGAAARSR